MTKSEVNSTITRLWQEFVSNLAATLSQSESMVSNITALANSGQHFAGQNYSVQLNAGLSLKLTVVNGIREQRYFVGGSITGTLARLQQSNSDPPDSQNTNSAS